MIKNILTIVLILYSINVFSQKELMNGFIVTVTNDTISGKLKNKNYYSAYKIKMYSGNNHVFYPKNRIIEISINDVKYIKSDNGIWSKAFFNKKFEGSINLYTTRRKSYLGVYDSDINFGRLKKSLKFLCDDYPNLNDKIQDINKTNVTDFLKDYNDWKISNPQSQSYYEKNIHRKKFLNFKLSYLLPGFGIEFGLSDKFTLNSMIKTEFGYSSNVGFYSNPFIDNQLRYYHNIDKRIKNNKKTYKYSGNYLSLVYIMFLENNDKLLGIEYGWQRTLGKHWYYNIGLGAGKWLGFNEYALIYDIDFGYNF